MSGFPNKAVELITLDGRNITLTKEITYVAQDGTTYIFPIGATSDGISSPPEIWAVRPPFGKDFLAGVGHDCFYRNSALIQNSDGTRTVANLPKEKCDLLLREMAIALGDSDAEADALYYGVKDFGWSSFDSDRAA